MDTSELVSLHKQKQQIISTELIYKLLRRVRGQFLILVCLVNFQSSGKGSNSSSEHVGKQFYTSEDDSHSILLI